MTRVEIIYDGHPYTLPGASFEDLKARILATANGDEPFWLTVNEGAGTFKATDLLITSSSHISLAEIRRDSND